MTKSLLLGGPNAEFQAVSGSKITFELGTVDSPTTDGSFLIDEDVAASNVDGWGILRSIAPS